MSIGREVCTTNIYCTYIYKYIHKKIPYFVNKRVVLVEVVVVVVVTEVAVVVVVVIMQ